MTFLSESEKRTLHMICETLVPALAPGPGEDESLCAYCAVDHGLAGLLEDALQRATDDASKRDLKQFFALLESPLVNGLTAGEWRAFTQLDLETRVRALRSWADSRLFIRRKAFQGIKRLALFLAYAGMPADQPNPTWPAIRYSGPPGASQDMPRRILPFAISAPTVLRTDALVIGSGAGGGVVAGELSAAGLDVIVVEKGGDHAEADFEGSEIRGNEYLYEKYGALTTVDTAISVQAGSTLGGGTTVNWAASFRTPAHVLEEWEREYGFSGATGAAYARSLDAVMQRINVNTEESIPNRTNEELERGCRALGYHVDVIARNVRGCEDCGFCGYGCPLGAKQGTLKTYLQDAYERGARIIVRAYAQRVLHENGVATGAELIVEDAEGRRHPVTVRAKVVVVSAGAIHTPALLLRSGLTNANIGANLHLHPVVVTFGIFEQDVYPWRGVPMSRYSAQFANQDGRHYGAVLETAPAHPGLSAASLPWTSPREHKALMQNIHRMANIIVLTRDRYGGRVKLDREGQPLLDYRLHPYDARHMLRGMLAALRIHHAAGAVEVSGSHNVRTRFRRDQDTDFEAYLQRVERAGIQRNALAVFSAHQMSSCRIAGDSARGAVDPTGETYEIRNLYVADASVFPTASGVNPMVSIMGAAHYIAQHIKARL